MGLDQNLIFGITVLCLSNVRRTSFTEISRVHAKRAYINVCVFSFRDDLLEQKASASRRKKKLGKKLKSFEDNFAKKNGRFVSVKTSSLYN